ncbi:MAG: hypothetical protein C0401_06465 [Anaerolinea sp.]|nr:hypothetical protein [Anaerolinea sp.]
MNPGWPDDKSNFLKPAQKVDIKTKYHEMYEEMRRHRDHELIASNWYTIILLAIIGGVITLKTSEGGLHFLHHLNCIEIFLLKKFLIFMAITIVTSGIFMVIYSHSQYRKLRDWVDENLEPENEKHKFPKTTCPINPHHMIIFTFVVLLLLACVIIGFL